MVSKQVIQTQLSTTLATLQNFANAMFAALQTNLTAAQKQQLIRNINIVHNKLIELRNRKQQYKITVCNTCSSTPYTNTDKVVFKNLISVKGTALQDGTNAQLAELLLAQKMVDSVTDPRTQTVTMPVNSDYAGGVLTTYEQPPVIVSNKPVNTAKQSSFPWWLVAVGVGTAALAADKQKKSSIGSILPKGYDPLITGGVILLGGYLLVVNPILKKIGLKKSDDEVAVDTLIATGTPQTNPLDPNFWRVAPNGSLLLTASSADNYAKRIYDAFGAFNDNEDAVFAVFRAIKTQSQVSFVADRFGQKYNQDLLTFLKGGNWPQDRLSAADVNSIIQIVKGKPKYKP